MCTEFFLSRTMGAAEWTLRNNDVTCSAASSLAIKERPV